jgi:hypothetical protein
MGSARSAIHFLSLRPLRVSSSRLCANTPFRSDCARPAPRPSARRFRCLALSSDADGGDAICARSAGARPNQRRLDLANVWRGLCRSTAHRSHTETGVSACKRKEEQQSHGTQQPGPKKPRLVFTDIQRRTLQVSIAVTRRCDWEEGGVPGHLPRDQAPIARDAADNRPATRSHRGHR